MSIDIRPGDHSDLYITETHVVNSQAAMLALDAHRGDIAVRTDLSKTFVLTNDSPAVLASWQEVLFAAPVTSVQAKTGVVVLAPSDVGAAATVHGHAESDVTGLVADLSGKAASVHSHGWSDVSKVGAIPGDVGAAATAHTHAGGDVTSAVANATHAATADSASTATDTDGKITSHKGDASAHHAKYTDGEAVTAMGVKGTSNPLHHDRYTDGEAQSALSGALDGKSDTGHGHAWADVSKVGAIPGDVGAAATVHTHGGGDITSAVANATDADTVDGQHAAAFAVAAHTHEGTAILSTGATVGKILTANGSNASTWESAPATGQTIYDAIVAPSGGDYTNIATALATEGANKSILIKRGTYAESANMAFTATQHVYIDDAIINFADGFGMIMASNVVLEGKVKLNGIGYLFAANSYGLLWEESSVVGVDASRCRIELNQTDKPGAAAQKGAFILGDHGKYWLYSENVALTSASDIGVVYIGEGENYSENKIEIINFTGNCAVDYNMTGVMVGTTSHVKLNLTIDGLVNAQGNLTFGLRAWDSDFCNYIVDINGVTTTSGNKGTGVEMNGNYVSIRGNSRDCDLANFTQTGTGNVYGGLAS